jgi:hypothetical protein
VTSRLDGLCFYASYASHYHRYCDYFFHMASIEWFLLF